VQHQSFCLRIWGKDQCLRTLTWCLWLKIRASTLGREYWVSVVIWWLSMVSHYTKSGLHVGEVKVIFNDPLCFGHFPHPLVYRHWFWPLSNIWCTFAVSGSPGLLGTEDLMLLFYLWIEFCTLVSLFLGSLKMGQKSSIWIYTLTWICLSICCRIAGIALILYGMEIG